LNQGLGCVQVIEKTLVKKGVPLSELRFKIAQCLLRIYDANNKAIMVLNSLVSHEIKQSENVETLWRGNTVGSKAIDSYMKQAAHKYLLNAVHGICDKLYKLKKPLATSDKASGPLIQLLDDFFKDLYDHTDDCPASLRQLFCHLQTKAEARFPSNKDVRYTCVSGFLFLRFINAAILSPKQFNIMPEEPSPLAKQNLTLVAKIIQKIANIVPAEGEQKILNEFMMKQQLLVKFFIDAIGTPLEESYKMADAVSDVDLERELSFLVEHLENHLNLIGDTYISSKKNDLKSLLVLEQFIDILDNMAVKQNSRAPILPLLRTQGRVPFSLHNASSPAVGKENAEVETRLSSPKLRRRSKPKLKQPALVIDAVEFG